MNNENIELKKNLDLGIRYIQRKEFNEAIKIYEKILTEHPNNFDANKIFAPPLIEAKKIEQQKKKIAQEQAKQNEELLKKYTEGTRFIMHRRSVHFYKSHISSTSYVYCSYCIIRSTR